MTATESSTTPWTHCYRLRRSVRNIGVATIVFGTLVGVGSSLVAWFNADGSFANPVLAAILFAVFWSAVVMLGISLVLLYYRYRLFTNSSTILQLGVIRKQHAELDRVDVLAWRRFPQGGSARLSSAFGVLKIDFGNVEPAQREHLVTFFRQTIDQSRQHQWQEFCDHFAETPEKRERGRRTLIRFGFLFIAIGFAFLGTWLAGFGVKCLVTAITNTVVGVFVVRRGFRTARPDK